MPSSPTTPTAAQDAVSGPMLICRLGEQRFALPMQDVAEVRRVPPIRRIPLTPDALLGLASLRASVVPIFALDRLLALEETVPDDDTGRVVVMDLGHTLGLRVDAVENVVSLSEEHDPQPAEQANEYGICGHHRDEQGRVIQWLDIEHLTRGQLLVNATSTQSSSLPDESGTFNPSAFAAETVVDDTVSLVSFDLNGQRFAFRLAQVHQIVRMPQTVSAIPNAPDYLLGLMSLRDQTLPLVALGPYFALTSSHSDQAPIVVLQFDNFRIGLVVDDVHQVHRISPQRLDKVPAMTAGGLDESLEGVCRPDGDHPMITVLDADTFGQLAKQYGISKATHRSGRTADTDAAERSGADTLKILELTVGEERFGLPIEVVQEIAQYPADPRQIPATPDFLDGMMNLRGRALPIMNVGRRLGMTPQEDMQTTAKTRPRRIVVVDHRDTKTALAVDSVDDVTQIQPQWIQDADKVFLGGQTLVKGMIQLPTSDRVIQQLSLDALFDADTRAQLASTQESPQDEEPTARPVAEAVDD